MFDDPISILAPDEKTAQAMSDEARTLGAQVANTYIWNGPVPPNSYFQLSPYVRMSRPEFFFYRKANQLPAEEAIAIGNELCSFYATNLTKPIVPPGECEILDTQRTTVDLIREYLVPVADTEEGQRALVILARVQDGLTIA